MDHLSPHLQAYKRPTLRPAPSWPDSSTGWALHWRCRGQGSNALSGLSLCCLSSAKRRWSNSFIPIRISNTWKIPVLSSSRTHTIYDTFHSREFYDVWRVLIADAKSFQAFRHLGLYDTFSLNVMLVSIRCQERSIQTMSSCFIVNFKSTRLWPCL